MIVTSKRCFINCLAQFMDHQQLLGANYYVCDVSNSAARTVSFNKTTEYDSNGNLMIHETPVMTGPSMTRFNIHYSEGWLDPSANVLNRANGKSMNVTTLTNGVMIDLFREHLIDPFTIGNVYSWLYGSMNAPKGNGLMIIIINKEDHVRIFGDTICKYLSRFFGEDIEFVDAQFRPQLIPGLTHYAGDKAFAEKVLRDQRDYSLGASFMQMVSGMGYSETRANLMAFVESLPPPQLMHLYELVFPNEPLPPGNYTTDHVKKVLLGKAMDLYQSKAHSTPSMYDSNIYLDSLNDEMNRLSSDE